MKQLIRKTTSSLCVCVPSLHSDNTAKPYTLSPIGSSLRGEITEGMLGISFLLLSFSDGRILRVPSVETKTSGQRSFSYAGPSIWNKHPHGISSSVKNLFQKSPQNPSFCRALLNHRMFYPVCHNCRSLIVVFFVFVVVVFTLPSTTSVAVIIIVYCTSVGCLHLLRCSCSCCCVVVLINLVLLWTALSPKKGWSALENFFIIIMISFSFHLSVLF